MQAGKPAAYRLVLLGPPASGKGTQGSFITHRWGIPVTSIGEVLRRETAEGTDMGVEAAVYTGRGQLVPDRIALHSIEGWMDSQGGSFAFDGFPRTIGQAEELERLLARRNLPLTAVLWLEVSPEVIKERVSRRLVCSKCGRTFAVGWHVLHAKSACPACGGVLEARLDDDPATLTTRLAQYRERTEPLMHFYEERGLLRRIDADGPAEQVSQRIEQALSAASAETAK